MKGRLAKSMIIVMIATLFITMMPMTASAATKAPGRVKVTSVKNAAVSGATCKTTLTVKWKKVKNATGYQIYGRRYDENWVKIKTVGKKTKLKIKGVYSGDFDIRVRAIRKKGGKTYKGKFTEVHKYITCPITLEQYVKRIDPMRDHADQSIVYDTYYKGNTQYNIVTLEMFRQDLADKTAEEANTPELRADYADRLAHTALATNNNERADFLIGKTGVRSANVVTIIRFKGTEVARHTYTGTRRH